MTRQQAIDRWKDVIRSVFAAEDKLSAQWHERLSATKEMPPEERRKLADEYLTAIANEILSKTSDEELENM